MLDSILSGISGGVFGIIGALAKHGLEIWQAKQKAAADLDLLKQQNKHELDLADKRANEIQLEATNALALAELNRQKETDVAAYGALASSYDSDRAHYSDAPLSPWMIAVDASRGFIRPVLTVTFAVALIAFTAWLYNNVPAEYTHNEDFLKATFYRLIDALIFVGTCSIMWWFGGRGTSGKG
jgi:hypothetical protein